MSKNRKADTQIPFDCSKAFLFVYGEKSAKAANDLLASWQKTRRIAKILAKQLTKEKTCLPKQRSTLSAPLHEVDALLEEAERTVLKDLRFNLRDVNKLKKLSL